jgi:hypothetical protein
MTPATGTERVRRRLEVTLHALLGGRWDVRWGPVLAGAGQTLWLPLEWVPFEVHLVRALQAAVVGTEPAVSGADADAGGWREVLLNLRAERVVRQRFPGLGHTYEAQRAIVLAGRGAESAEPPGPGDRFLQLILSRDPLPRPSVPESAAVRCWLPTWRAWVLGEGRAIPVPPVPPPSRRMWNQAARRSLPAARHQGITVAAAVGGGPPAGLPAAGGAGERPMVSSQSGWLSRAEVQAAGAGEGLAPRPPGGAAVAEPVEPTAWYDEWDVDRGAYRPRWCAVYDHPPTGVGSTPDRNGGPTPAAVRRVQRGFERYRAPNRWSRADREGTELDVDAAVGARAEAGAQGFATDRVFMSRVVEEAEAAVAVLVDLSESVFGVTLDIEKEALQLLGTALDAIGDTFALYGFQGRSRLRCELVRIKDFDDPYPSTATRIGGLQAAGYTRIAPALRHVTARLRLVGAHHRILLLVTDGMPFDIEGYGGTYAVEDTRRGWLEARARGVHPYCLNVDFTANQYLARMCGPSSWTVVSERRRLPDALLSLYQRVRR